MSTSWNVFKTYEINEKHGYPRIEYLDWESVDLGTRANIIILSSLNAFGVEPPSYMRCSPPASGKLDLIEPEVIKSTCQKAIALINNNTVTGEDKKKRDRLLKDIDGDMGDAIEYLEEIIEFSEEGYYIVLDRD